MVNKQDDRPYAGDLLTLAQELVAKLQAGDESRASELVTEIGRTHESSLFLQVGKLTRQLHESLNSFSLEPRVVMLADEEIPNARERLNHVIALTQQSAERTLTAVEASLPLIDEISAQAKAMRMRSRGGASAQDPVTGRTERDVSELLEIAIRNGATIHGNLGEIMQAQEFQDLTGQVIQRVIKLIQEVEVNLVRLIRMSGCKAQEPAEERVELQRAVGSECFGPVVPGVDSTNSVVSQDEVDDLLASMGF